MKGFFIKFLVCGLILLPLFATGATPIRFGVTYFYPPFVFSTNSGYIHGFDIDVAKAICQQLQTQCTFKAVPFAELINDLNQNKFDAIMGAISITPQRQTRIDFTKSYFKNTMSLVTLVQSSVDPDNLQGKKIGVQKNSTFSAYLAKKYGNSVQVVDFNNNEEVMNGLSNKVVDLVSIDTPTANYWVGYSTGLFKTIGKPVFLEFDEGYGIGVKKGNTALANSLNSALDTIMQNGTFEQIKQKYAKYFNPKASQ
jgi:ABC-type amino acid transport substrate-binding protein